MSSPAWLADFQRDFGSVLRTPLITVRQQLQADSSAYDSGICALSAPGPSLAAEQRLAIYNRQYWLRLFDVLHQAYPLLSHGLGHWSMNQLLTQYLLAHPPEGHDIDQLATALQAFLREAPEHLSAQLPVGAPAHMCELLVECATVDTHWRDVFSAPEQRPFRPSDGDLPRLAGSRLLPSKAWARVTQRWPLLQLRPRVVEAGLSRSELWELPQGTEHWALFRVESALGQVRLDPIEARLLELLSTQTVEGALAQLQAALDETHRQHLLGHVHEWLSRSVRLGFWVGIA